MVPLPRLMQVLRFNQRQIEFVFKARRALGEVWSMQAYRDADVVTSHPDHVRSLFTASAEDAMAEQRVVLETMARRLDLVPADPEPEHALHRNVTMIPSRGAQVVVRSRVR